MLQSLDTALLRFINISLSNPLFDKLMPFFSDNSLFFPALILLAILLLTKGGTRGRVFVFMLLAVVALGDGWICKTLKEVIGRPRPFNDVPDIHLLLGKGGSGSMPSSHAANWFSGAMVAFIYYRRSWLYMLPLAIIVAFSRVYNGVHYPSDVFAGAILGAGYGAAFVFGFNYLWTTLGKRWLPLWWQKLPSFVTFEKCEAPFASTPTLNPQPSTLDQQYLRLGYVIIFVLAALRLWYLASEKIQLSEDEAYQWLWSKHLALSYYSKPPMIAYLQWLGTTIWGDTQLGVRFFSPLISAALSLLTLRFLAREASARIGFLAVLAFNATPLLAGGSILMTIDPPLILFWTAAMFMGWKAAQSNGTTAQWAWAGFFLGLSFLAKYAALYQVICWALFFILWKPARIHLRKPGPYLALFIVALSLIPVIVWNAQNDWITVSHVGDNAGRGGSPWTFTMKYFWDFLGSQAGVLNPIFFVLMLWAMFAFWKREKSQLHIFLYCMGAPVFLGYALFTFYKRVNPNWIAPAILPLFCLALIYWDARWKAGVRAIKGWVIAGLTLGFVVVILAHDTNLISKIAKRPLPGKFDISHRVRAWDEVAAATDETRQKLLADGKPVFIIGEHYGLVGEISFYLPEARTGAQKREPLAYYRTSPKPDNQLYFWPEYRYRDHRKGQNAIFVKQVHLKNPNNDPFPEYLKEEFASVEDLGRKEILYRGRVFHILHFYACRDLK